MKQYETPELSVRLLRQDVITSSTSMDTYDDTGCWGDKWGKDLGGNG